MKLCGIDFESTGFPATTCRITELGAAMFRVSDDNEIIQSSLHVNQLVWDPSYPEQEAEVVEVTGITDQMLRDSGVPLPTVLTEVFQMFESVYWPEYFIAHNKAFDATLFKAEVHRQYDAIAAAVGAPIVERFLEIPWLCTLKDVQHPKKFKSHKLAHLALDYGCPVDPNELHRSIADVNLMIKMIARGKFDLRAMAGLSKIPNVVIRALVPSPFGKSGDGGTGKDKAKACGFGWERPPGCDGPIIKNAWLKQVKENEVENEKKALGGYEVAIVETFKG